MVEIWKLPDRADREGVVGKRDATHAPVPEEVATLVRAPVANSSDVLFDVLESNLVRRSAQAGVRSLMLTGPAIGAGVSTVAARFAQAASRDPSVRVLLVDTHLRAPSLDRIFALSDGDSFFDLLTGATGLETLAPSRVDRLNVLAAGRSIPDPRAFFRGGILKKLVDDLARLYDLVVFDAPPICDCAEARMLAAHVDSIVLVVRGGHTTRRDGRLAIHEIRETGTPLMGVVLNGARSYIPRWLYDRL